MYNFELLRICDTNYFMDRKNKYLIRRVRVASVVFRFYTRSVIVALTIHAFCHWLPEGPFVALGALVEPPFIERLAYERAAVSQLFFHLGVF